MRKNKWFGRVLIATMMGASFSACNNTAEEMPTQKKEIKLTSEIAPSRVLNQDYQSTQIVKGQQVGVTIIGAKNPHANVAWTVGTDSRLTNEGETVYWDCGEVTITAYHPYHSTWTGTSHTFSVSTDQSNEENYRNSDLLWTTALAAPMDTPVTLLFSHKLAKINVTIQSEEISDLSDATIYICGTQTAVNLNLSTGELSTAMNNVADIKAATTTDLAYSASAIIIPQVVASGTDFIRVEHQGKVYNYQLPEKIEYQSGKSYTYLLDIKKKDGDCEGNMNGGGNGWN